MRYRNDLIIDVGMHTGEDTTAFLAAGFNVVAVEANPDLIEAAAHRFSGEISAGKLQVVSAAIAEKRGVARFGVSSNSIWSSMDPEMISRNERVGGATYQYIEVETVPFEEIIEQFGMPHYLKVDIEGSDMLCIRALRDFQIRPPCVSIESHVSINRARADAVFDELAEFWTLGYRKFRYVPQDGEATHIPDARAWRGPSWRSATSTVLRGQGLRAHHNLAGLGGRWAGTIPAEAYRAARKSLRRGIPWYDLQATLL